MWVNPAGNTEPNASDLIDDEGDTRRIPIVKKILSVRRLGRGWLAMTGDGLGATRDESPRNRPEDDVEVAKIRPSPVKRIFPRFRREISPPG